MGNYTRQAYHAARPAWRNNFNKTGKYIGIEFELEARGSYRSVLALLPDISNRHRPITEQDGSLTEGGGLEIVFPPFLASTLKKKNSTFAKAIAAISSAVRHAPGAGMHMNINTRGWPALKQANFVAIINNLPHQWLERIGQRTLTSYCRQNTNRSITIYGTVGTTGGCAAELKVNRIECRFPRSTVIHERVANLIEFFEHVEKFAETCGVIDGRTSGHIRNRYHDTIEAGPAPNYNQMRVDFERFMSRGKRRNRIKEILFHGYTESTAEVATVVTAAPVTAVCPSPPTASPVVIVQNGQFLLRYADGTQIAL